jgi:hypothetical protein
MGLCACDNRLPLKRDATDSRRLSGILPLRAIFFPVLPENFPLRHVREFWCKHLIHQMIFGKLSDLRRGIEEIPGYFPGSREFVR